MRPRAAQMRRFLTIALAAVPAGAAGALPLWMATITASEIASDLGLGESGTGIAWIGGLAIALSVVVLKFLMPLEARDRALTGTSKKPFAIWAVWLFSFLLSALIVFWTGLRLLPLDTPSSVLGLCGAVWLCIEVTGTLALPTLARPRADVRCSIQPAPAPSGPMRPRKIGNRPPSASSADELFIWLTSLFGLPDDKLPEGVEIDHDLRVVMTSQRKLARARQQPRTNVVRLLKQLEREGRLEIGITHRDTWIHIPAPGPQK